MKSVKSLITIIVLFLGFIVAFTAHAGQINRVVGVAAWDSLKVRTGPGVRFPDIGGISPNATVEVLSYHANMRWAKIGWRGGFAYISSKYLKPISSGSSNATGSWVSPGGYLVSISANDPGLNLRTRPTKAGNIIARLQNNTRVLVIRRSKNSHWVYVKAPNGDRGYVYDKFLVSARASTDLPGSGNTGNNGNNGSNTNGNSSNSICELPGVYTVINVSAGNRLPIKIAADANSNTVGSYGPSDAVAALSFLPSGWYKVSFEEQTGFVDSAFLQCGGHTTNQAGFPTNLICFGTEPFWSMNIHNNGTIDYRGPNDPAPNAGMLQSTIADATTNSYPFTFAAVPYSGTISRSTCSDGMSDGTYIWGAQINVPNSSGGFDSVNGCCRMK